MSRRSAQGERPLSPAGLLGGLLVLLACQWLGEVIRFATGLPLPAPVLGMMLLLGILLVRGGVPPWLGATSQRLISMLSLMFLPPAVGLFFLGRDFADQWPAVIGAVLLGTVMTVAIVGLLMNALVGREPSDS